MSSFDRAMTFPEFLRFRAERGVSCAVIQAARQNRTSTSEYLRRALREKLAADGVTLPPLDDLSDRKVA